MLNSRREELAGTPAGVSAPKANVAGSSTKVELSAEIGSLRGKLNPTCIRCADVASDLLSTRKELSEQAVGLRRAVIEYHTSIIGQARMRRVEQHLNLPSLHPTGARAKRYVVALFAAA